ncbi:MAG: hypothetical protein H3C43_14235 [Leptonema sp. (in: Bacteria)]|nr:hypothetical protein [Leptonema sp. (in: bacteria)]
MSYKPEILLCPAKINLGLSVPYKRTDGYHEIESLFLPIDYCDELTVSLSNQTQFHSENLIPVATKLDFEAVSERGNPKNNLLLKVIEAANQHRSIQLNIFLKKRIPSGAGLGGGSSNAGRLLSWLVNQNLLSHKEAFDIAVSNGSDIAFFLNPTAASVKGTGDQILHFTDTDSAKLSQLRGILVLSNIVVSTKFAYSELKRPLQSASVSKSGRSLSPQAAFNALLDGDAETLAQLSNDFEEVVFRLHPELDEVKSALNKNGAFYSSMTGSGSGLFGIFTSSTGFEESFRSLEAQFTDFCFVRFGFFM